MKVIIRKRRSYWKRKSAGLPKRLKLLRKSREIKRWFLRNPWIRPMSSFNYAALKIQQTFRGHLVRTNRFLGKRRGYALSSPNSPRSIGSRGASLLDKYLATLESYSRRGARKPLIISAGYAGWCAVYIQAFWRMVFCRSRYLIRRSFIHQIAAIVIQTSYRNFVRLRAEEIQYNIDKALALIAEPNRDAALTIQMLWRTYCNKRIYRYFRDLILKKLKGAPNDLLRTIIPSESDLLDRASGVHVRFRLGM